MCEKIEHHTHTNTHSQHIIFPSFKLIILINLLGMDFLMSLNHITSSATNQLILKACLHSMPLVFPVALPTRLLSFRPIAQSLFNWMMPQPHPPTMTRLLPSMHPLAQSLTTICSQPSRRSLLQICLRAMVLLLLTSPNGKLAKKERLDQNRLWRRWKRKKNCGCGLDHRFIIRFLEHQIARDLDRRFFIRLLEHWIARDLLHRFKNQQTAHRLNQSHPSKYQYKPI